MFGWDNIYINLVLYMPDNRPFIPQEDKIIKELYEEQKIANWAIIARKLTEEHHFPRNAKQCRDR